MARELKKDLEIYCKDKGCKHCYVTNFGPGLFELLDVPSVDFSDEVIREMLRDVWITT